MRRSGQLGFTLTELLVVMAIIMGLAAAAVPALAAFRRGQRLDHAGRIVQGALNDARRRAITLHARHVVVFFTEEQTQGEADTVRHGIKIYQEPTGVAPGTPGVPANVTRGYFKGGYVGEPIILPANVRFKQDVMACTLSSPMPAEDSDFFKRKLRGERTQALAYQHDGTIEERDDESGTPSSGSAAGRNIFMPDEGFYQVPKGQRADIVLTETDPTGNEVVSNGKSRRALVDLTLSTGRGMARVFDIGTEYEFMPTAGQTGTGGN